MAAISVSLVIPCYNEEDSLPELGTRQSYLSLQKRLAADALAVLCQSPRTVLVLDDLHEADPESLETLRLRADAPKGAAKLAAAGVKFGFESGGAAAIGDFFTNAGKAIENGLSKDAAIRAMISSVTTQFSMACVLALSPTVGRRMTSWREKSECR